MMLGVGMIALGVTGIIFKDFMLEWSQVQPDFRLTQRSLICTA